MTTLTEKLTALAEEWEREAKALAAMNDREWNLGTYTRIEECEEKAEALRSLLASASTPEAAAPGPEVEALVDAFRNRAQWFQVADGEDEAEAEADMNAARARLLSAIGSSVAAAREEGRRTGIGEARDVAIRWARSGGAGRWSSQAIADDIAALAEKTETSPTPTEDHHDD